MCGIYARNIGTYMRDSKEAMSRTTEVNLKTEASVLRFSCVIQHYSIYTIILSLVGWHVETLNTTVDRELDALPSEIRARFVRICGLIAAVGVERMGAPHVKHLTGPLWEMRLRGRDGISRALYVTVRDKRVVVVRVFLKKTRKTPRQEINLALRRAKEVLE